jgi:photosystem II stability/assembly factor-like uncharacterized protein
LTVAAIPANAQMGVWRDINPDAYIQPPANPQLNSVYMISPNEGWAVGDSEPTTNTTTGLPAIFYYDGSTWNLVPAPKFPDFKFTQHAYNLTSVSFGPPNSPISRSDGWAVGYNDTFGSKFGANQSIALHWDGVSWRPQVSGFIGTDAGPLWSDFMVSSTDVWAVGQTQGPNAAAMGTFWHWTGVPGLGGSWNEPQASVATTIFYSVFMVSTSEGWAVGFCSKCPTPGASNIYHYTGGAWAAFSSPVTSALRSVFMNSATDGWAVGDSGTILHFTSGTWSGPVSPGTTTNNLYSVFMVSSTEGWAFGAHGTILHYTGGTWTAMPVSEVPTTPVASLNFNSGYFNSANDGWAVGTDGVILHFDGVNYGTVTSPTVNNFTSISFGPPLTGPISPNDGWAVGNASFSPPSYACCSNEPTIYHWNGFMWTKGVVIGATNNLNSVFMLNTGDAWTVGGGIRPTASCALDACPIILHFTGGSWNTVTPPPGPYILRSVFMVSSSEGWAVGQQESVPNATAIIIHYTVTGGVGTWAIFPSPTSPSPTPPLNSVFMLGQNEGWAVGDNATILHYIVTGGTGTWNKISVSGTPTLSTDANLTSIFMLSPNNGWAVGGIQAKSSFSAGPVIIHWDGTKWEPVAVPSIPGGISPTGHTSATLKSVFFTSADDGWAVGFPGKLVATILHWDGFAWNHVTTSPALLGEVPPILMSVYMTEPDNGWIVGSSPEFHSPTYFAGPGFKQPLSTILRFSPFGGIFSTTLTSTVVSTVSTSTTGVTTTFSATTSVVTMPGNIQITIKVVDNFGNPVQGATVSIPSLGLSAVTNSQGIVTFSVPQGTYVITVTKGTNTATSTISATSNGQMFTITLAGAGAGIPGFPIESILAGVLLGLGALLMLRRRVRRVGGR